MFAWSMLSRSHDSCTWSLNVPNNTDSPPARQLSTVRTKGRNTHARGKQANISDFYDGQQGSSGQCLYECTVPMLWQTYTTIKGKT
jgi:hypothetical protein